MVHILEQPIRHWCCPSCKQRTVTRGADRPGVNSTEFHLCPALHNLNAPMVEVNGPADVPDARHVLVQREDHGFSIADRFGAIRTERPDGSNDTVVFAPCATVTGRGLNAPR